MGKKKKKSLNTMGTADNPFKCGKGSDCPDKECRLWHPPPDSDQNHQLPQLNQNGHQTQTQTPDKECNLWHPPDQHQDQLSQFNQKAGSSVGVAQKEVGTNEKIARRRKGTALGTNLMHTDEFR